MLATIGLRPRSRRAARGIGGAETPRSSDWRCVPRIAARPRKAKPGHAKPSHATQGVHSLPTTTVTRTARAARPSTVSLLPPSEGGVGVVWGGAGRKLTRVAAPQYFRGKLSSSSWLREAHSTHLRQKERTSQSAGSTHNLFVLLRSSARPHGHENPAPPRPEPAARSRRARPRPGGRTWPAWSGPTGVGPGPRQEVNEFTSLRSGGPSQSPG